MEISTDHSQVIITGQDLLLRPLLVFQINKNLPLCFSIQETPQASIIKIEPKGKQNDLRKQSQKKPN
jgi:hypothetical protein